MIMYFSQFEHTANDYLSEIQQTVFLSLSIRIQIIIRC
jgi:hypothetical protein